MNPRNLSGAIKAEVVIEVIKGIQVVAELADRYEVHPYQVSQWKREFLDRDGGIFEVDKR